MNQLTENHFSFKCRMNWEEMEPSTNGRFCGKCRKEVFDLTNCSIDEVIALQRKHGPICGSIRLAQVAAATLSLSAAACQNTTEPRMAGTPIALQSGDQPVRHKNIVGEIAPPERSDHQRGK